MSTDDATRTGLPSDKPRGSVLERGLYKALAEAAIESMINRQSAVERLVGSWEILPPAKLGELLASIDPDTLDDDDAIEFLKASARHRAWTESLQSAALNRFAELRPQLDGPARKAFPNSPRGKYQPPWQCRTSRPAKPSKKPNSSMSSCPARQTPCRPAGWISSGPQ